MTDQRRIVLIDDHRIVRAGLRLLLEADPALQVVGEAGNREEALAVVRGSQPDLILLDLDLGGVSATGFLTELRQAGGEVPVIVLTGLRDPALHAEAVRQGAMGVVLKEQASEEIFDAIRRVLGGGTWLDPPLLRRALAEERRQSEEIDEEAERLKRLTPREREVIACVAQGMKNAQIARRLYLSEGTVRKHLTSIFQKLSVGDRTELALYALRHGLDSG